MGKMQTVIQHIKSYVIITFGLLMMAFGWTAFLIPNELLGGGVSGVATLIYWSTGLSTGVTILAVNVVLVIIALKILGFGFGIKTIYSICCSPFSFRCFRFFLTDHF